MTLIELSEKIRQWANDRNLVNGSDPKSQFAKLISEFGEKGLNIFYVHEAINGEFNPAADVQKIKDDIGDQYVVLTILCAQMGYAIEGFMMKDAIPVGNIPFAEFLLLSSAYGKMGDAILKGDDEGFESCVRRAISLLNQVANKLSWTLEECLEVAYNDIKDRRGVMYNGAFVKSTDARYEACCAEVGVEP